MKSNVGTIDKVLRAIIGVALVTWAAMGGPIWAWIGVVPLATAIFGWCPAYTLFGVDTYGNKASPTAE